MVSSCREIKPQQLLPHLCRQRMAAAELCPYLVCTEDSTFDICGHTEKLERRLCPTTMRDNC